MKRSLFCLIFSPLMLIAELNFNDSLLIKKRSSYVTNPCRSDGFGAQFQTIIYSIIFAEINRSAYLYTPLRAMEHNYDQDPHFLERMEALMNLIDYYPINQNQMVQKNNTMQLIHFFENHLSKCVNSKSLKRIKALFRLNKDRRHLFPSDQFNIAIHIRRKNPHDTRSLKTDIPDSFYLKLIDQLRSQYHDKAPLFHLFSQGDENSFKEIYAGADILLHVNTSIEYAFTSMALADLLVTAPSSFSYTAGILSDGIIYYVPFWHPPLPGWIVINEPQKNLAESRHKKSPKTHLKDAAYALDQT